MKKLLTSLLIATLSSVVVVNASFAAEHETKQVCKDKTDKAGKPVMDKKTGKPAQECKQVKMHKKLEVTK